MFTGLIQDIGTVQAVKQQGDWTLTLGTRLPIDGLAVGASVACNGICVTLTAKGNDFFKAQFSTETLNKTTVKDWRVGTCVNLERALRAGDELGGHYVSGHVDGVARLIDQQPEGDSLRMLFDLPQDFARFVAPKGSVTLDGVSLTVNEVEGTTFGVNLIPHTQAVTTLGALKIGDVVNFEIDMIARYIARMLGPRA